MQDQATPLALTAMGIPMAGAAVSSIVAEATEAAVWPDGKLWKSDGFLRSPGIQLCG